MGRNEHESLNDGLLVRKSTAAAIPPDSYVGRVLGSYRTLALLGEGGMGRVYLAEHIKLGRRVALKLLRPEYAAKREAVQRFFQEARAVNSIGHEHIVDVTDYVELENGETFFIMEFLDGSDLSAILRSRDEPLPLRTGLEIALQVSKALIAVHEHGIVHRDLKPDNIFVVTVDERLVVKLLDFGVAKLVGEHNSEASWQTAAGSIIGTPAYMAPEQASGLNVDHRADIYSFGAILYEMFTGRPVFQAKSFGEFVVKHLNENPIPPRELPGAPPLPEGLERAVLRCLKKDPKSRFESIVSLRNELLAIARQLGLAEGHNGLSLQTVANVAAHAAPDPNGVRSARTRRWWPIAIALVMLGGASMAFWLAAGLGGGGGSTQPTGHEQANRSQGALAERQEAARSAQVQLHSWPQGAEVIRQDTGESLGLTPVDATLNDAGKEVAFLFRRSGFRDATRRVIIEDGALVSVTLERLPDEVANENSRYSTAAESDRYNSGASPPRGGSALYKSAGRTHRGTRRAHGSPRRKGTTPVVKTVPVNGASARSTPRVVIPPNKTVDPFAY